MPPFSTSSTQGTWHVERDAPTDEAYAALATDRRWNGYSIADLAPATRQWTRVAVARQRHEQGAETEAACLFYQHPAFNSLIPHGDPAGVAAILVDAATAGLLPAETYILAQEPQIAALMEHYLFPQGLRPMLRMAVDRARFTPPTGANTARRLHDADLASLLDFYATYPDSTFTADQLTHGVFYGVREGGRLVAAGGTHVVAAEYGLAAVGNIFVVPEVRGRGLGGVVTAAIVGELLADSCREVILNVVAANMPATRLYRRLGFTAHCAYSEARAVLSQPTITAEKE
ncbi:MAG TPA: GNAT family N-acetyltransferase [Thermomicrobiales bacterium]|jgi:ribosomal protein S18 acetylase RimI-like enzyme